MSKTSWMNLAFDSWSLGLEASAVIGLRLSRLALLDAAAMAESQLMVREKIEAATQLQLQALTGGLGSTPQSAMRRSLSHYRKGVRKKSPPIVTSETVMTGAVKIAMPSPCCSRMIPQLCWRGTEPIFVAPCAAPLAGRAVDLDAQTREVRSKNHGQWLGA